MAGPMNCPLPGDAGKCEGVLLAAGECSIMQNKPNFPRVVPCETKPICGVEQSGDRGTLRQTKPVCPAGLPENALPLMGGFEMRPCEQDWLCETKPICTVGEPRDRGTLCETNPICPVGQMVCTAHPTERRRICGATKQSQFPGPVPLPGRERTVRNKANPAPETVCGVTTSGTRSAKQSQLAGRGLGAQGGRQEIPAGIPRNKANLLATGRERRDRRGWLRKTKPIGRRPN